MIKATAPETIRTPRLTLRALRPDDREAITEKIGNYDVARWLSVVPYPYSLSDADEFLKEVIAKCSPVWAICDKDGLQGVISLDNQLGYWLARPVWGRGYLTEAGNALIDYAFKNTDIDEIPVYAFVENHRSRNVLKKLGFVETGTKRSQARALAQEVDAVTLALTRLRWQERHRREFR